MSTNDTVLFLANGASGTSVTEGADLLEAFHQAALGVCARLARMIAGDGERIEHIVDLHISGAPSENAAEKVARAIGNSLLVKTSWFGADPNWGRIVDAAGYARVGISMEKLSLWYDDVAVLEKGTPREENLNRWREVVANRNFSIRLDLGIGKGEFHLISTDLTAGYVDFNKSE